MIYIHLDSRRTGKITSLKCSFEDQKWHPSENEWAACHLTCSSVLVLRSIRWATPFYCHRFVSWLSVIQRLSGSSCTYLSGRGHRITIRGCLSERVPEGSCLGPPLFTSYSRSLIDAVQDHLPSIHCYADDTQLYVSFDPVMKETSQMRLPLWSVTLSPSGSGW